MKFNLPIKSTYVSSWGLWETIREFVQNAKDEEEQHGHPMTVKHSGGVLTLHNEGADLDRRALLIGHTGKAGADVRGKHGEGLNLALLAGARIGRKITVDTKSERWTPTIEYSKEFDAECLSIATRARGGKSGVTVSVEVTEEEWTQYKERFIFLCRIDDNKIVRVDGTGSILLEEARRGHIYVRGIYVDYLPKMESGYDMERMDLDRDRRMINVWDLQYRLGAMYREAVTARPELLGPKLYRMVRDGVEDAGGFHYHADTKSVESMVQAFREEHGDEAVPVTSIGDAREVEYLGKRGIVVKETLLDVLKVGMGDLDTMRESVKTEVLRSVPWSDLSVQQKAVCTQYTSLIDSLRVIREPIATRMDIVEFRSPKVEGIYIVKDRKIGIALKTLEDPRKFLVVLVHELAHMISECGDEQPGHASAIEEIWSKLYFLRTAS